MGVRSWLRQAWDLIGADLPLFSIAAFLTISISLLTAFILALPLVVGMCIMFQEKLNGRQPELKHLWEGITAHFPASFGVYLIYMAGGLPFDFANFALHYQPAPWPVVGVALAVIGLWIVGTPLFFALQLIADRDLSGREALRMSWQQVRSRPLSILLLVIVCSLVMAVGLFACGFGLIITLPLVVAILVLAYRDLVGNAGAPELTPLRDDVPPAAGGSVEVDDDENS